MNRFLSVGAAVASAFFAMPSLAQNAGAFMNNPAFAGPRPRQCTTTFEMQHCAASDLRTADRKMSVRYTQLRSRLRPAARAGLLTEQRAWLRSRDRDCLARRVGGSSGSLAVAQCWVNVTEVRATALGNRLGKGTANKVGSSSAAFVGRWRGGEGTFLEISQRADGFQIENQWGLDADMRGVFHGDLNSGQLTFKRNGVVETIRPGRGDGTNRSAIAGKTECLIIGPDEGYCRYLD